MQAVFLLWFFPRRFLSRRHGADSMHFSLSERKVRKETDKRADYGKILSFSARGLFNADEQMISAIWRPVAVYRNCNATESPKM